MFSIADPQGVIDGYVNPVNWNGIYAKDLIRRHSRGVGAGAGAEAVVHEGPCSMVADFRRR